MHTGLSSTPIAREMVHKHFPSSWSFSASLTSGSVLRPESFFTKCLGWMKGKRLVPHHLICSQGMWSPIWQICGTLLRTTDAQNEQTYAPWVSVARTNGRWVLLHIGEAMSVIWTEMDKKYTVRTINKTRDISSSATFICERQPTKHMEDFTYRPAVSA